MRIAGTNRASAQIQTGTTIEKTSRVGILRELLRVFNRKLKAKFFAEIILLTLILIVGLEVRLHYATFLDPFEDGYQNWWISANLVQTGQYWDRHSMMTQGNWLPLYHFFSAGVLELAGLRSMEGLKVANIVLSTATALTVYSICRKRGPLVALTATAFFSLNFIDIVVSGWATAESLTSLLVLLGYATLFQFNRPQTGRYWIAAVALALAVVTRYEAWMITSLLVAFLALSRIEKEKRQLMIIATLPAIAAMLAYFAYSIQWGFLPSIVVNQTSTDIRYQLSAGTQPSPTDLLFRFWSGYLGFFPLVLLFGGT